MACRIIYNEDNTVKRVLASNGEPSLLYNAIRSKFNEEQALLEYSATFTPEFEEIVLNLFGDSELFGNEYDENGEIAYHIFEYIMHPEVITGATIEPIKNNINNSSNSLFGLNLQNENELEFHINTLNVINQFLENVGVEQRLVPEFLSYDGSVVEGAIAAANFLNGTVDILDDINKRPAAWNKLPEEAAHWWYRLLKDSDALKEQLFEQALFSDKFRELKDQQYGGLTKDSDITEESIGQLIAEAIKRIEDKNAAPEDYSFLKKILEWVNSILDTFRNIEKDPFEVAAMKILSSDMSNLMTWEEYRKLNNIVNFADVLTEQSVAPLDYTIIQDIGIVDEKINYDDEYYSTSTFQFVYPVYEETDGWGGLGGTVQLHKEPLSPVFNTKEELDNWVRKEYGKEHDRRQKAIIQEVRDNQKFFDRLLNKSFKKKSKYLPKTLRKYFDIIDSQNLNPLREWDISQELQQITKKLSEQEKKQIVETNGYTNIAPTLKVLPDLLQKYRKNPIVLSEPIKIDGAKKQELSILNGIREMIKLENPNLKSITAEEFVAEAHNWLETNYLLGFANEQAYLTYHVDQTFTHVKDRFSNEASPLVNMTEEEINRLPFEERQRIANIVGLTKQNPDVYHNKVSIRFNDMSHLKHGHFNLPNGGSPSAWGNLTYFYTGKNKWKDAVLLHEIQNDNIEFLREFKAEKVDLETSLGRYLQQLNTDLLDNITQIESGGKKIIKNNVWSTNPPKQHLQLNYQLEQLKNLPLEQGLQQLKQSLNERIELYKSDASKNPEKAQEAVDKAYSQRRIFQDFQKRGGIKSLLTKEELEDLKNILHQLNTEEIETSTWSADDNVYFPDLDVRDLKQKKQDFKTQTNSLQVKINSKLKEMYGDNAPLINLTAPAKPRTKSQIRQGVQRSQELNENVNWLLAYSEKKILDKLSKNIEESKRNYIQARNATVANNFNVQLSKITLEQWGNLVENYKYNQDLLKKLIDEQAQKDINSSELQKQSKAKSIISYLGDDPSVKLGKGKYGFMWDTANTEKGIVAVWDAYKNANTSEDSYIDNWSVDEFLKYVKEVAPEYLSLDTKSIDKEKQQTKFETLKQKALDKKAELEKNYGKIEEEVKQTLEIEMNYFTPLVHHLIQKHINQYGKDFPMYFSGYNITKLTQGNDRTALIYAGKDEINLIDGPFEINNKKYEAGLIDKDNKPITYKITNTKTKEVEAWVWKDYNTSIKIFEYKKHIKGQSEKMLISEQEYNRIKQEYEKAYQQATERRAKEIKFEAAKQIGFLSNEYNGTNLSDLTDKQLEEGIKELNQYKRQSKQNMDRVINTIMNISNSKPIETGAIYNAMSQVSGIKLIWQDKIDGLQGNTGGYLVDLSNYNYNVPILYGLQNNKPQENNSFQQFQQSLNKPNTNPILQGNQEAVITPNDKIIWGHPGIGKTFLHEQGKDNIIDFDSVYKSRINKELGLPEGKDGWKFRNEWRKTHEEEWKQKVRQLWKEAKEEAKKTNKILLASDIILLREFSSDFDKVINMSDETFIKRAKQRNDYSEGNTEGWKSNINEVLKNVDKSKVVSTDKYLSDLFTNTQQEQTKKFTELQERLNNKEFVGGAKNAFESSEELQQFGTQEQYNDYIARVSLGIIKNPSSGEYNYYSKVKDIVYHFSTVKIDKPNKEKFSLSANINRRKGFFGISKNINPGNNFANVEGSIPHAMLFNMKNPDFGDFSILPPVVAKDKTKDSAIIKQRGDINYYAVFEPEQIHILSSKADIQGFKEFVKESSKPKVPQITDEHGNTWNEVIIDSNRDTSPIVFNKVQTEDTNIAEPILNKIADRLATQLGVKYNVISSQMAYDMLTDGGVKYNNEPAFFYKGQVYLISDKINLENIFHEFSHPFVQALNKANPLLFDKLYNEIQNTEEGLNIINLVKQFYPDLSDNDFKEEVFVRVLTKKAQNLELGNIESSAFKKIVDKILYSIKQALRKLFGKIKIEKLSVNTSIDELAKMLQNDSFDVLPISESDMAYFNNELKDAIKEIDRKVTDQLLQQGINQFFTLIKSGQSDVKKAENKYPGVKESLSKSNNSEPFSDESEFLYKYQTITKSNPDPIDLADYRQKQIEAFVISLNHYNDSITKVSLEVDRIAAENSDSGETMGKLSYFQKILKDNIKVYEELKQTFLEQNVDISSPIFKLLNETTNNANFTISKIQREYKRILPKVLGPLLQGVNDVVIQTYNMTIDKMRTNGAPQSEISKKEKERDSYLKDEDYLARVLVGEEPEPSLLGLSTLVESAVSSPDGLISSFAKFVKRAMIDVDINATNNYNEFIKDLLPKLKEAGLDDFKIISKLGKLITYEEQIGRTNPETGEFEKSGVIRFLSPFKDYELKLSEFEHNINKAIKDGNKELVREIQEERTNWRRRYMHDKYTPEVYEIYEYFKRTLTQADGTVIPIGQIAKERLDKIFEDIENGDQLLNSEFERIEISNRLRKDALWAEYKKLYSIYDDKGILKSDVELAITQVLLDYRNKRREYFEWEQDLDSTSKPIVRFEKARNIFIEQLLTKYNEDDPGFKKDLDNWDKANTRTVIDKQFYIDKADLLNKIQAVYAKIGSSKEDLKRLDEIKEYWNVIIDQLYAFRDEENHPNGMLISKEKTAKIKEAQEAVIALQEQIKKGGGLSKAQAKRYEELSMKEDSGALLTDEEYYELDFLEMNRGSSTIPKGLRNELKVLFKELNELQSRRATDYYLMVYNKQLQLHRERMDAKGKLSNVNNFDIFNIDDLAVDKGFVDSLKAKDKEFAKWFNANHIVVSRFDEDLRRYVDKYERLYTWNQIEPNDDKYLRNTRLSDNTKINGLPSLSYYKQVIKPEFETDTTKVGETVDNRGHFLPRNIEGSPYINQEYYELQRHNPKAFAVLESIVSHHLKFQENVDNKFKLWLDVPRYDKSTKELTETGQIITNRTNRARTIFNNILNQIRPDANDADEGLTRLQEFTLSKLDYFNNDEQTIHVTGRTMMKTDQVSLDVITSVLRHMHSLVRANKLEEIHPISKGLLDVLNDPKNQPKDTSKASWYHWVTKSIPVFANKKGENIRAKAIKGLIDRTFYNVQQTGFGSDAVVLQKVSKLMMKAASFGFFALDIPSGLKNRFGQQLQQTIQLAAGDTYDAKSFFKGKAIASKTMLDISMNIYNKGVLPLSVQLMNAFDPSQGRFSDILPEMVTRTFYKDAADPFNAMMSPRKFMELEATLEFFYGVMEFTKVKQTLNGETIEIPYHEAFELKDNALTLKEGIDSEWGLTGEKFKKIRMFIQEKQNILNGVYSKFDQPEGNRYLFYRMFMFLRKFFVTGFLNRFGYSGSIFSPRYRRNNASETIEMGYIIQFIRSFSKLVTSFGKHWAFMLPQEKAAMGKAISEMSLLTTLALLTPMVFGWDGDDEDKYNKLRARQGGPLGSDKFKLGGWTANHLLYQTFAVASENTQYYKIGFYSDMLSNFNLANGPSLQTYGKILNDVYLMATGNKTAYYARDIGPYSWQKAESAKIANHIGKAFALTGKSIDPQKAIQDFISAENIY